MSRMTVAGVVGTLLMASAAHAGVTLSDAEKSRIRSEIESAAQAVVAAAEAVVHVDRQVGPTTPVRPFVWTILWRREEGHWRMLQVHQSFGPPEVTR